jgi:hypothetical protein
VSYLLSLFSFFVVVIIFALGVDDFMKGTFFSNFISLPCWGFFILAPIVAIVPGYVIRYIKRQLQPTVDTVIREKELTVVPKRRKAKRSRLVRCWEMMVGCCSRVDENVRDTYRGMIEKGNDDNEEEDVLSPPPSYLSPSIVDDSAISPYTGFAFNFTEAVDTQNRYPILDVSDTRVV